MASLKEAIKNTQNSLGKIVKKPPLRDKELTRPPFRFLHDVISTVIKDTGALKGLYGANEMKSDHAKDRDSKMKYIEKAVFCVSFAVGEALGVKPAKVVAGQEAEKTNEFLQVLARVVKEKIDTKAHVKRVLNGEKPDSNKENNNVSNGDKSRRGSNASGDRSDSRDNQRSRSKDKGAAVGKNKRSSSKDSKAASRESTASNGRAIEKIVESQEGGGGGGDDVEDEGAAAVTGAAELETLAEEENAASPAAMPNGTSSNGLENGIQDDDERAEADQRKTNAAAVAPAKEEEENNGGERPTTTRRQAKKSSRKGERSAPMKAEHPEIGGSDAHVFGNGGDATGVNGEVQSPDAGPPAPTPRPGSGMKSARPRTGRLKSARPPSARPAAPRLKEKTEVLAEEELQARPQTGKVANVILAGAGDDSDDAEEFLVEEKPKDQLDLIAEASANTTQADTVALETTGGEEHGGLVQQILSTQKELTEQPQQQKGVEIERDSGISDAGRRRDRESTQKEVDKLRESIQTLTRSANPLGKLMDFLQEDVDAMQRELDTWKQENKRLNQELKHEQKVTEQSIEPLKVHLGDLETAVKEQLDKISVVKSNIIKNDDRIQKMIGSIGHANR